VGGYFQAATGDGFDRVAGPVLTCRHGARAIEKSAGGQQMTSPTIRQIEPDDWARLARFWPRLSEETIYRRFLAPQRRLPDDLVHRLVEVDHKLRDALVAIVDDEIIGVARYDCSTAEPTSAEFALVVEDGWQGRGVGSRLLDEIIILTVRCGVHTLTASVLTENTQMLAMLRNRAPLIRLRLDTPGVYTVEMPLDPV
jgi:GNAT superfamily N-acetyltransferase